MLCHLKTSAETRTFVFPTASLLHLIYASSLICSVSFCTGAHQLLHKDNKSLCDFPLSHLPLSLIFFAPVVLLKSFTCWTNISRGVSAHIPTFLIFFSSRVLALLFHFTTYSLLLLGSGNSFDIFHVVGDVKGSAFLSKSIYLPSSHLSQVNRRICSYLELHGHWFRSVELLPFRGWSLCFVETSWLKPVHIQISEPLLFILFDHPSYC